MTPSQADYARQAASPWRGKGRNYAASRATKLSRNARRRQQALAKLSASELETGKPDAYWQEWHRQNRERVLARWGG